MSCQPKIPATSEPAPAEIVVRGLNFAYATASNGDVFETAAQRRARRAGQVPETTPEIPALADINFECAPGSLTLLCGASGCGKSTLLRALNGLVPFFHRGTLRGEVTVGGLEVPQAPLALLGDTSATVFQNPRTQFFTADVTSELAFRGENAGEPPTQIWQDVLGACAQLDTAKFLGRPLGALSGGELQKIACTAALASGRRILLFDEPTSNLSPQAIAEFAGVLAQLKTAGYTMVIAEHRLYFLADLANRVLVLEHGRIVRDCSGQVFFALPDSTRRELGLRTLQEPTLAAYSAHLRPESRLAPHESESTAQGDATTPAPHEAADLSLLYSRTAPDTATADSSGGGGLRLENLRFSYGSREILHIPDSTFPAGQVSVLVGQNGVGKTTLSRVICGLAKASGRISLDGRPLSRRERQRAAYIVMQDVHRQLFADSVLAEVTLGQKPYRPGHEEPLRDSATPQNPPAKPIPQNPPGSGLDTASKSSTRRTALSVSSRMAPPPQRIQEILADLDLWDLRERHPLSLSGGQKQRLVIASALAWRKQVYIFDEPTSGVDFRHLTQIAAQLRALASNGAVVIVVTHDFELAERAADAVFRLAPHEPGTKA